MRPKITIAAISRIYKIYFADRIFLIRFAQGYESFNKILAMNTMAELIKTVIGASFTVHNSLGSGFVETVYSNALAVELRQQDIFAIREHPIDVFYSGVQVGSYRADLFVEDSLIVECKAAKELALDHEIQLVNYLKATGIEYGLLINFSPAGVVYKKKFKTFHK